MKKNTIDKSIDNDLEINIHPPYAASLTINPVQFIPYHESFEIIDELVKGLLYSGEYLKRYADKLAVRLYESGCQSQMGAMLTLIADGSFCNFIEHMNECERREKAH